MTFNQYKQVCEPSRRLLENIQLTEGAKHRGVLESSPPAIQVSTPSAAAGIFRREIWESSNAVSWVESIHVLVMRNIFSYA